MPRLSGKTNFVCARSIIVRPGASCRICSACLDLFGNPNFMRTHSVNVRHGASCRSVGVVMVLKVLFGKEGKNQEAEPKPEPRP